MSHSISPSISSKQIFNVRVTEIDFVSSNKIVRDISKNIKNQLALKNVFALVSSLYKLLLIKLKLIVYILLIKTYKKLN